MRKGKIYLLARKIKHKFVPRKKNIDEKVSENDWRQTFNPNEILNICSNKNIDQIVFRDDFATPRIAVHAHIFYVETAIGIIESFNEIPYRFDCYISTDSIEKKRTLESLFSSTCKAENVVVEVFENKGRDVAPFILQMRPRIDRYDYVGHVHSKKTKTGNYGEGWRSFLFHHLFGNSNYIKEIFNIFEIKKDVGILFPETYPLLIKQAVWGGNKEKCKKLLESLDIDIELPKVPVFPVGNMFWARTVAIRSIFISEMSMSDFPEENGQLNLTLGHQIERSWVYIAQNAGYRYEKIFNNWIIGEMPNKKRIIFYVHYNDQMKLSEDDLKSLEAFRKCSEYIFFITNSHLEQNDKERVLEIADIYRERANNGYDFGAWKDALLEFGFDKLREYDEVILTNNSYIMTSIPMNRMFYEMKDKKVDFWGVTVFPFLNDGSFINKKTIPRHLQSYFQVYRKKAFTSRAFRKFWTTTGYYDNYIEVVGNQESKLTCLLQRNHLKYSAYLEDSDIMNNMVSNYSLPYQYPYELLILGMPFIKKKAMRMANEYELKSIKKFYKNVGEEA